MKNEDYRVLRTGVNVTTHAVVLPPGTYTASFFAKRDPAAKGRIHCWVPNYHRSSPYAAISRKAIGRFTLTPQWKRYSITFEVRKAKPVELHMNVISFGDKNCRAYVDALQLEKGGGLTAFEPAAAEGRLLTSSAVNFIDADKKVQGRLLVTTARPNMAGTVSVRVKNFFGKVLLTQKIPFQTNRSKTAIVPLKLDSIKELGVFMIRCDFALENGKKTYTHHRYAKVKFMNGTHRLKNLFSLSYGGPARDHRYPEILKRWRKLGVGCKAQHELRTPDVYALERKYDVYPMYSNLMSYTSNGRKMTGFCIVDAPETYRFRTTNPKDPRILVRDYYRDGNGTIDKKYLAKFSDAVCKVVKKYPHVDTWLLGGEIIAKFPAEFWSKEQTPEAAAKAHALLLKGFADGVKRANPKAKLIQDDPCNMRPEGGIAETERLLVECNKLGVKFDIIGIHPYRAKPEEPDLDSDTQKLLAMLDKVGYSKVDVIWPEMMHWGPFEIPQWGTQSATWSGPPRTWFGSLISYDMGKTEKKSAAWYTRSYLVALKYSDRVKTATASNTANNCNMDVMFTPYAAQLVPNTLSNLLGDSTFKADIRFAPFIRAYVYEDAQKRPVAALWCYDSGVEDGFKKAPVVMTDFGSSLENVFTMMNSPVPFNKGKYKYAITQYPVFFRGKKGTTKQMIRALQNTTILSGEGIAPVTAMIHPANENQAVVYLKNLLSKPFTGTLAGRKITIPSSGSKTVHLPLKKKITANAMTNQNFDLEMKSSTGATFRFRQSFDSLAVRSVPENAAFKTIAWDKLPKVSFVRKVKNVRTSGTYSVAWNSKGLFIQSEIKDAVFHHFPYPKWGSHWQNDCMQFYIDTMGDARIKRRGYDENDYDYAVFPKADAKSSVTFRFRSVEQQLGLATQAPPDMTVAPDIPSSFSYKNGIATYRVFVPAKYLLPMQLKKGTAFGFGLYIPDYIAKGKSTGGLTLSENNDGCYIKPHTWPLVYLAE